MRKILGFTFVALVSLGLASPLGAAPQFGRQRDRDRGEGQVCIYKDIHYVGAEQCFNAGDSIATLQSLNHQPSSIRIYGRASVTVFDDSNFRGHSTVFSSSVPDLGQVRLESKSWNDRIQSLQVTWDSGYFGRPGSAQQPYPAYPNQQPYPSQQISEGICVYERPNYEGRSQCWTGN